MTLTTDKSLFEDADAFYAALIEAIDGMPEAEAMRFMTRLILILANEVGGKEALEQAIEAARPPEDNAP